LLATYTLVSLPAPRRVSGCSRRRRGGGGGGAPSGLPIAGVAPTEPPVWNFQRSTPALLTAKTAPLSEPK